MLAGLQLVHFPSDLYYIYNVLQCIFWSQGNVAFLEFAVKLYSSK